jgi:hypothetical protein
MGWTHTQLQLCPKEPVAWDPLPVGHLEDIASPATRQMTFMERNKVGGADCLPTGRRLDTRAVEEVCAPLTATSAIHKMGAQTLLDISVRMSTAAG